MDFNEFQVLNGKLTQNAKKFLERVRAKPIPAPLDWVTGDADRTFFFKAGIFEFALAWYAEDVSLMFFELTFWEPADPGNGNQFAPLPSYSSVETIVDYLSKMATYDDVIMRYPIITSMLRQLMTRSDNDSVVAYLQGELP